MLNHDQRLQAARGAVDYITSRDPAEQQVPVPNCPGWTVYNAAVHIGRVSIAWEEMIRAAPDDPESRARGYARSETKPEGSPMQDMASWAHAALDQLENDLDRACYFSMAGGEGTVRLWAWHAASELGIHRLDVESALGHSYAMTQAEALDAITYTCEYFLPAMRRATGRDPGRAQLGFTGSRPAEVITIDSSRDRFVAIEGPPIQVLLALWGRPHDDVVAIDGDADVWAEWRSLPGEAFQFGTWD